jgi:hypothetical protein
VSRAVAEVEKEEAITGGLIPDLNLVLIGGDFFDLEECLELDDCLELDSLEVDRFVAWDLEELAKERVLAEGRLEFTSAGGKSEATLDA